MRRIVGVTLVPLFALYMPAVAVSQKCGDKFRIELSTPREVVARMIVSYLFSDVPLPESRHSKAVTIVEKGIDDASKLDRSSSNFHKDLAALHAGMRSDLLMLLTKDADRTKLVACFQLLDKAKDRGSGPGLR